MIPCTPTGSHLIDRGVELRIGEIGRKLDEDRAPTRAGQRCLGAVELDEVPEDAAKGNGLLELP